MPLCLARESSKLGGRLRSPLPSLFVCQGVVAVFMGRINVTWCGASCSNNYSVRTRTSGAPSGVGCFGGVYRRVLVCDSVVFGQDPISDCSVPSSFKLKKSKDWSTCCNIRAKPLHRTPSFEQKHQLRFDPKRRPRRCLESMSLHPVVFSGPGMLFVLAGERIVRELRKQVPDGCPASGSRFPRAAPRPDSGPSNPGGFRVFRSVRDRRCRSLYHGDL